jgi:hypothetical protein
MVFPDPETSNLLSIMETLLAILDLALPDIVIPTPIFRHLTFRQWWKHGKSWFQSSVTADEWLEMKGLPCRPEVRHRIQPPAFYHLSPAQWREHGKSWYESGLHIDQWLQSKSLPARPVANFRN